MLIRLKRSRRRGCPVRLEASSAEDERERSLRARPGLAHELAAAAADDEPEREAQEHRVVELPDARQEVGNQVDREGQIAEDKEEAQLVFGCEMR